MIILVIAFCKSITTFTQFSQNNHYFLIGHCKVIPNDLRIDEHPSCYLSFVQVGGDVDVVRRGCTVQTVETPILGQDILDDEFKIKQHMTYNSYNFTCKHDIDNDYFTSCVCHSNFCNHANFPTPILPKPSIIDPGYKQIVDEVNRSIRQLRSDIKRTLSEEIEKAMKCND